MGENTEMNQLGHMGKSERGTSPGLPAACYGCASHQSGTEQNTRFSVPQKNVEKMATISLHTFLRTLSAISFCCQNT